MPDTTDPPSWKVDVSANESGISRVTFTVDVYEPAADVETAMRHLCAASLWWLDTRQFESLGMGDA